MLAYIRRWATPIQARSSRISRLSIMKRRLIKKTIILIRVFCRCSRRRRNEDSVGIFNLVRMSNRYWTRKRLNSRPQLKHKWLDIHRKPVIKIHSEISPQNQETWPKTALGEMFLPRTCLGRSRLLQMARLEWPSNKAFFKRIVTSKYKWVYSTKYRNQIRLSNKQIKLMLISPDTNSRAYFHLLIKTRITYLSTGKILWPSSWWTKRWARL